MDDLSQFRDLFFETAGEHIEKLKSLIFRYKTNKDNNLIAEVHLHLHSLKGEVLAMKFTAFGKYITVLELYVKNIKNTNVQIPEKNLMIIENSVLEVNNILEIIKTVQNEPLDLEEKSNKLSELLGLTV